MPKFSLIILTGISLSWLYLADGNQRHNEKYERLWDKLEILLDQQAITETIMIRNIWKSNLILITVYL